MEKSYYSSSLRFRPIAPRPTNSGADANASPSSILVTATGSKRGRKRNKSRFYRNSGGADRRKKMLRESTEETQIAPMAAAAESWLTVEFVMNISYSHGGATADAEMLRDLETDTCPGFVTDGWNKVMWVNKAYKRMVAEDRQLPSCVRVWLVIKEELQPKIFNCSGFSCWLNLKYTWHHELDTSCQSRVMVVPCDVNKMEHRGGFAWRLDLTAALRLGS